MNLMYSIITQLKYVFKFNCIIFYVCLLKRSRILAIIVSISLHINVMGPIQNLNPRTHDYFVLLIKKKCIYFVFNKYHFNSR